MQSLRNKNERSGQLLIRMAGPDFCRRQAESVHVDRGVGCGHLFFAHMLRVKVRANFAFFLVSETDKYVCMFARLNFHRLVQRRQKGRTTPIANDSVACRDVIEMRADDDDAA
jgi:hypothetical protein